jgi:hypothetical protein
MNDTNEHEQHTGNVGYGHPPEHSRFKKGQSGNAKGRPKGSLNFATVLARTLREKVVVNEGGRRKTVTKLEAAVKQLVNRSASGDQRSIQHLLMLVRSAEERAQEGAGAAPQLEEDDAKVLHDMLERMGIKPNGEQDQ